MSNYILDKLLTIENDSKILSYKYSFKDFAMYPLIRYELMLYGLYEHQGINIINNRVGFFRKIKYVFKTFLYRAQKAKEAAVVFLGTDLSNISTPFGYFNRLTELFANQYKDETVLVEMSDFFDYKKPRTYSKVYSHDWTILLSIVMSKFKKHKSSDLSEIEQFVAFLKNNFNYKFKDEEPWNKIRQRLLFYSLVLPYLYKGYTNLFKKLMPKLILIQGGCYGNLHAVAIRVAKEMSIPTAEYQHGVSSFNCPAYNYSEKLISDYKIYLPETYLSYGEYFEKRCRLPISIVTIGNPYLSEVAKTKNTKNKPLQLLYISSKLNPNRYVSDVLYLKKKLETFNISVVFRVHPSEFNRINDIYRPLINSGIKIDTGNLYKCLNNSTFIVGDFSMVLYEATAFDNIIFVVDSEVSRMHIDSSHFNMVSNMKSVVESITSRSYTQIRNQKFFANNWKSNYKKFIEPYLKDKSI